MFSCSQCDKTFTTKQSLHKHCYYLHTTTKKYVCEYCGKEEYTKSVLVQHMNSCIDAINEGYEPELFECNLCDKIFKQKGNLDSHRKKEHKIEKPHTRITRNKARMKLASSRYYMIENTNMRSPKRFYIIDRCEVSHELYNNNVMNEHYFDNIRFTENELIGHINIINKFLCKAMCKNLCDNMNIIEGLYNMNWGKDEIYCTKQENNIFKIWKTLSCSISSLQEDRPKQHSDIIFALNIVKCLN